MARPSKLNEELIKQAYKLALLGVPVNYICDSLGITQPCHSMWMTQGKQDYEAEEETLYAQYFMTIKKGQADFVIKSVADIQSGRQGWQGAAWVLERTRQDFMPKQEITAGDDGKVTVVLGGKIKEVKSNTLNNDNTK